MPALIHGVAQLKLGLEAADEVKKAIDAVKGVSVSNVGKFYYHVRDLIEKRSIPNLSGRFKTSSDSDDADPVQSPAVRGLQNLYKENHPHGVVYVMYDKPGMGKTTSGEALLKNFFRFPSSGDEIKGLMITGDLMEQDYVSKVTGQLDSDGIAGWLHALLLAMNEPRGKPPSLLILDAFNSVGQDEVNLEFIRSLYSEMNMLRAKMNIFVVVMTQAKTVANRLCGMNGGVRVQPLPGFYEGSKMSPEWNEEEWPRELLIEAIRYEYPGDFESDEACTFIEEGMSPMQASQLAGVEIRRRGVRKIEAPESPRKKAKIVPKIVQRHTRLSVLVGAIQMTTNKSGTG